VPRGLARSRLPVPEGRPRLPIPCRRPPSAILAVPLSICACVPPFLRRCCCHSAFRPPRSALPLFRSYSIALCIPHFALVTPFPALLYSHRCPQVFGAPFSGAYGISFDSAKSYPQRRMHIRPCRKPSNSSQNRSNGVKIGSKKDKKGARFVMPILTFLGWTPSGASARAVFAFRKGQKPCFRGSKRPCGKVIHKMWKTLAAPGPRERPTPRRREPASAWLRRALLAEVIGPVWPILSAHPWLAATGVRRVRPPAC